VRLALLQQQKGGEPDGRIIIPGVLPYDLYLKRRTTWDPIMQCVGLDAEFYEGADVLMFPPEWLNLGEVIASELSPRRRARGIGVDPAEGGDKTSMAAVDEWGVIEVVSKHTPDTSVVTAETIAFMRKHEVPAEKVLFDRGGGGKEHADRLRLQGYNVQTVGFGEPVSQPLKRRSVTPLADKVDVAENRYSYKNRRGQMYGDLRNLFDPAGRDGFRGYGLPAFMVELRRQLAPIPLLFDSEGRMELPPKHKRDKFDTRVTLIDIVGHSPDEADSVALAVHSMIHSPQKVVIGSGMPRARIGSGLPSASRWRRLRY